MSQKKWLFFLKASLIGIIFSTFRISEFASHHFPLMSDLGDDDVHMCDTCMDMFLTRDELKQHEEEKHSGKEEAKEEPSKAKRSRSSSPSDEAPKKKVKMGPASKVRRDRSSSSEISSSKKKESISPNNGVGVAKIIDRLASTESDCGSHKSERSDRDRKDHKKHKH